MKRKMVSRMMARIAAVVMGVCALAPSCMEVRAESAPAITYKAHVENIGWQSSVRDGETAGTTGKSYRLEAFTMKLTDGSGKSAVQYRAHVANVGWQPWKNSGEVAGTTGKALAVEAIRVKLTGSYADLYDVYYRTHVSNWGWTEWSRNGEVSGSTGMGVRAEAIQVRVVPKGTEVSGNGVTSLAKPALTYQAHCQDVGWQEAVGEGETAGTTGKSLRMEDLIVNLKDFSGQSGISYRGHVSNVGWKEWCASGQNAGTTGKSLAMEAVEMKLSSSLAVYYDLYYRAHAAGYGWLGWAKNGETAGTTGGGVPMEAVEIRLVRKGEAAPGGGTAYHDLSGSAGSAGAPAYTDLSAALYGNTGAYITCGFDGYTTTNGRHEGIDVYLRQDAPIYALLDGTVVRVAAGHNGSDGLSTIAIYDSRSNKTVLYLHANPAEGLCAGKTVSRGEQIGTQGWRGVSAASGSHTHVEVRDGRQEYASKSVNDPVLNNANPTAFWNANGYSVK